MKESDVSEVESGWHTKCVKKFFGTKTIPQIDISNEELEALAYKTANAGYTVPGVQKKLSLHLSGIEDSRLTLVNYPSGYILKPQTEEYENLPEAEHLCMQMAEKAGIKTVPHGLLYLKKDDRKPAYITKRVDRSITWKKGVEKVELFAMEDFCQLNFRLTEDKYRGSYEQCGKVVEKYSDRSGLDMTELFLRIVFSFVVGNSDMHLKNFSLIENQPGSRKFCLSEAYDLLPVNVIVPADKEQFALTMNGKKRNIRKKDFMIFAENIGLSEKQALAIIKKIKSLQETYTRMCRNSLIAEEMKQGMEALMKERFDIL